MEVYNVNKELEKIVMAADVTYIPDVTEYQKGIEDAQQAQEAAQKAKDEAETEQQFDLACDQAVRAREKEQFFKRKLNEILDTPMIDQPAYDHYIGIADGVITAAANKYMTIIERAVAEIVKARKEYVELCAQADEALEKLDAAANYLQSKYRYKVYHFHGAPDVYNEAPNEWRLHVVRYGNGEGHKRVTQTAAGKAAWKCASIMEGKQNYGY